MPKKQNERTKILSDIYGPEAENNVEEEEKATSSSITVGCNLRCSNGVLRMGNSGIEAESGDP
jgi:hypothetical protein